MQNPEEMWEMWGVTADCLLDVGQEKVTEEKLCDDARRIGEKVTFIA